MNPTEQEKRNSDLTRNLVGGTIVVIGGLFIISALYYLAKR